VRSFDGTRYHTRLFSQAAPKLTFVMASRSKWASIRRRRSGGRPVEAGGAPSPGAGQKLESVRYEGYGPGGAAVMVDCLTADRHLTGADIRQAFTRHGGHVGAFGSVSYLFNRVGLLTYPPGTDEERLMRVALEAGAEDVVPNADHSIEVLADPIEFETVRAILTDRGFAPVTAEVTERASLSTPLSGEEAVRMVRLLEALEELDCVRNVYSNVEIPDEVISAL
jgi:transcriptional/translational regulatory protein YebC/TACO1